MVFNSYTFIAFFIFILILHNLPFSWKVKKVNLLLASYIFYAAWNPPFILLLWLSTVVDFFVGRALYTQHNVTKKRLLLVISLIGNVGMLCFFKYGGFLLENFVSLVNLFGVDFHPAKPNIILPAGISFYTFTTLCYTIDMYYKKSEPVKSMLDFALFVTFFPHLVAGPIVRPPQLVPQFENEHKANLKMMMDGLLLLTFGLFMKVVLADGFLAPTANDVFGMTKALPAIDTWIGVLAFSGQIFFDFAGYSTCAVGAAMCLGFALPRNFRFPYAAIGFSDFWRRWHMTLSAWLRDYLYIPLGGNRKGTVRTYVNLMITMLLGGLWHGANWTFVVWGGLHGAYLWVEKFLRETFARPATQPLAATAGVTADAKPMGMIYALLTFFLVNVTWVFFRAGTFGQAWTMLGSMFGIIQNGEPLLTTIAIIKVWTVVTIMVVTHWWMRNTSILELAYKVPVWVVSAGWAFMLVALAISQESSSSFIYFQF
ncbi:MAG TPA: MBOAT family O-acyltransferase [Saprospiraceae bacterium]|nr:MBOAT family O-acyltransferase [Saprospiraceae bacterium]